MLKLGNVDFNKLMVTVLNLETRVTTLEGVVQELMNTGRVTQQEIEELKQKAKEKVKQDWPELNLN